MIKQFLVFATVAFGICVGAIPAHAVEQAKATMYLLTQSGTGAAIGTITMQDSAGGLVIIPDLKQLPPGSHGFHLHDNPNCGALEKDGVKIPGLAAGGHYDPDMTNKHLGPYGAGHRGDLPELVVDAKGNAKGVMIVPHLKLDDMYDHALIVHESGDNFDDKPAPLGGGGKRIACAVVE